MGAIETIRWLGDCLHDDRARRGVRDFTSAKVEVRKFLPGTELLATDDLPNEVVGAAYGKRMSQKLATHGRRKETIYGTLFLVGQFMGKTWCAPVLLYPGFVSRDGVGQIEVGHWKLNPVLRDELDLDDDFEADIDDLLDDGILTSSLVRRLAARLEASLTGLDLSEVKEFPHLAKAGDLDKRKTQDGLALISASAFGLLERSRGVGGILHELKALAVPKTPWSRPLEVLMGVRNEKGEDDSAPSYHVPAILSEAQERVVRSARKNTMTLCHGPPGTGKSFTIAAIAADHIARGECVLIASEKDHAVDVASEKIRRLMGGAEVTVRAGRSGYLRKLKRFVEDCLSGLQTASQEESVWRREQAELENTLGELAKRESWLEGEIKEALAHGELIADPKPGWWRRFLQRRVAKKVRARPLMMEVSGELDRTHQRRMRQARRLLRLKRSIQLANALKHVGVRAHFRTFLSGLRKRKPGDQEKMLGSVKWSLLLSTLPVWVVRLSDVHRVLPLERELFDVVIIDESTQCDLASVLPIFQRAKRVVVAGDQRQLRHVSFISRRRMESLALNYRVSESEQEMYDYRDRSLMDLAIDRVHDARQIGFLNEHFRSRQPIISFSNETFYSGRITVMTERPWESDEGALEVEYCGGTRDASGENAGEVERILEYLKELLREEPGGPPKLRPSIGILSPFRNQVEAIRAQLEEKLTSREFNALTREHRLLIGTAHSFQGEERDFMFLSFTVDPNTSATVHRFLERRDVFNVSITRARSYQRIFTSVTASDLPRGGLLGEYLGYIERSPERRNKKRPPLPDKFADDLRDGLLNHRCTVQRSVSVAGVPVDLLLTRDGKSLGIDLIGHPGEMREAIEEKRIRVLARAGFVLLPLGLAEWRTRKVDVLREILKRL